MPAVTGLVPQIVDGPSCKEANALLGLSRNGARIGGAALGGVLVAAVGPALAIGLDAASFFVSALLLASVRLAEPARAVRQAFTRDLIEGWREFRARRWVWLISMQYAITNAVGMGSFFVLGPLIAERSLGGPAAWGLVMSANACKHHVPPDKLSRVTAYRSVVLVDSDRRDPRRLRRHPRGDFDDVVDGGDRRDRDRRRDARRPRCPLGRRC
jgi:hypothetical protein